jgi:hypothetical protein
VHLFSRILALGATGLRALGRGVAIPAGHPRGILLSVLPTLKQHQIDMVGRRKRVLAYLVPDSLHDPWPPLFPEGPP